MKKSFLSIGRLFISLFFVFNFSLSGLIPAFAIVNSITPSTNDENRTKGWAHVDVESVDIGSTTLKFISTRAFYSCFEYRTDGDTSQKTSDSNYNTNVTDGLYPYYCQNNNTRTKTINAEKYVEIRMVFGAETDERFDWTRFDVIPFVNVPVHISPADDSYKTTTTQTLIDWEDIVDSSTPVKYKYQSSHANTFNPDGSFASPVYTSDLLNTSQISTLSTPQGVYYWHVKAINNDGYESAWSNAWKLTVDNTSPTKPSTIGFSNPVMSCGAQTNIGTVTVDWTDSTDNYALAGYDYLIDYPLPAGGRGTWAAFFLTSQYRGTLNQGLHRIKVRAKDKAGNVSEWTDLCDITYDSIPPVVPTGIYFKDTDNNKKISCGGYTNTKHVEVYWDAIVQDPSFSHYEYTSFNAPSGSIGLSSKIFYDNYFPCSWWTIPIEGVYGVQLRSVDTFENKSEWSGGALSIENSCKYIVDWTAPDVEITNPPEDRIHGIVDIRGSVTDVNPHHYWLAIYSGGTQKAGPGTINRTDSFTDELLMTWDTRAFPDGEYIIKLEGRDSANNKDDSSKDWHTVTVDNTGPSVFLTSPIDDFYTNEGSVLQTWDTLDTDVDHYEYRSCNNDPSAEECDLIYSTTRTTKSRTVTNNNIIFWWQVRGVDTLGNVGEWSDPRKITMEDIDPTVSLTSPTGYIKGSVDIIASFNDINPKQYTISITNTATSDKELLNTVLSGNFTNTNIYTWNTTTAPDGTYEIIFTCEDKAGNTATINQIVTVDNLNPTASVLGNISLIEGSTTTREITINDNIQLKEVCYAFDSSYICSLISGTAYSWDVSNLINTLGIGNFVFSYYVLDEAGNQSDYDTVALDNQVHISNITVNEKPEVQGAATTNTNVRKNVVLNNQDEAEEEETEEETKLLAEDLLTDEFGYGEGTVLAETDEEGTTEKKSAPWWVYLLIIFFILFIIIILWRRRAREEDETYR